MESGGDSAHRLNTAGASPRATSAVARKSRREVIGIDYRVDSKPSVPGVLPEGGIEIDLAQRDGQKYFERLDADLRHRILA